MKIISIIQHIILLLLLLLFTIPVNGQNKKSISKDRVSKSKINSQIQSKIINTSHTALWTYTNSSIEDKSGNIWFCTTGEGVYRYNGNGFIHYTTKDGLADNIVWCAFEDKSGNIWFGTSKGICYYNGHNIKKLVLPLPEGALFNPLKGIESFKNSTKDSPVYIAVTSILQDQYSNLWFGTNNGVYRYDGKNINNYLNNECIVPKEKQSDSNLRCHFVDKKGNIWFSFNMCSGACGFLYRLEASRINHPCLKNTCKHNLKLKQDLAEHNNEISSSFTKMKFQENAGNIDVTSMLEDKTGKIWIGTYDNGVYIYDGKSINHISEQENLNNNYFDGKIFTTLKKYEGLKNSYIKSIIEDQKGNIWFGTYGRSETNFEGNGLYKYDGKSFQHFTKKEGLSTNTINCLKIDRIGNLWVGTEAWGVSRYNGKSFTNFTEKDGLSDDNIWSILEDKTGKIWIGTNEQGVCYFDGKSIINFTEKVKR